MASSYLSLSHLAPAFTQGQLVLVPNNRLRNHLLRAFALQQTPKAWLKPNLFSLSQWLDNLWQELQALNYSPACVAIATPLQRQLLWEKAIANSSAGATLLQPKALAQQADAALSNLERWMLTDSDVDNANAMTDPSSNSVHFAGWLKTFRSLMHNQQSITQEDSHARIAQAFKDGVLPRYETIFLEGFDDVTPLARQVLEAATGRIVELPPQATPSTLLMRTQAKNTEEEIRAAAIWAKTHLRTQPEDALIGIVVPNLGQNRQHIERVFTEVFEPSAPLPSVARYTLPFNFSAGVPLGSTPLIHSLFEILQMNHSEWPLERLCNFLHSPFWGNAEEETVARGHITQRLRELKQMSVSLHDLHTTATHLETHITVFKVLAIAERIETLRNVLRRQSRTQSARDWLIHFREMLGIMGWPGTRRLDSQEYQQMKQWFEVCEQFAGVDRYAGPLHYQEACRLLRQLADKTPFQAQTPDSPIQILGALEAAGLQFSHLWVMGLNDNQWPPVPAPNPFIPLTLQRQHKMPHASAERELEIAQGLTNRYRQSAPQVVFSSAHSDGENEQRTSSLIRDIPLTPLEDITFSDNSTLQEYYAALATSNRLEIIQDASGPRWQHTEPLRGGSQLFKLQATCPFTAFAQLRLGAKNPDQPTLGFSPAERGNLLHDSLAGIWRRMQNSANLKATGDEDLRRIVDEVTHSIIQAAQQKNLRKLGKVYCQLEQERLSQLLYEWLTSEQERPAFSVVAIEQQETINFAGLTFSLRMDRVDQLANGMYLLIDYKTGQASSKSWLVDRFSEPQLPLYAVTTQAIAPISAIAFAVINRKQQLWDGLGASESEGHLPRSIKLTEDWAQQQQEWQEHLEKLANDFIEGDARIHFIDAKSKQYAADLIPLTRLADQAQISKLQTVQDEGIKT